MVRRVFDRPMSRRSTGFTLLEFLGVLILIGVVSVGLADLVSKYTASQRNAGVAADAVRLHEAVRSYVLANQSVIAAQPMPYTITLPMLRSPAVYLDAAYSGTNVEGQVPAIRVKKEVDGSLQVVIAYTGGESIDEGDLDEIAANIVAQGGSGGYVGAGQTSLAVGFQGSWQQDLSAFGLAPGPGHVVDFVTYAANANADDSLHRHAVAGAPQYNRMATDLDMGGNDILNAGTLNANQLVTPAGNGVKVGSTFFYGGSTGNAAIRTPGALYIDNQAGSAGANIARVGSITGQGGSTFTADDLVARGNVTANGTMYANWFRSQGNTGWYSQTYGGGWYMTDATWIRAYGNKNVYTTGEIRGGTIHSTGQVIADNVVVINGKAGVGAGCATKGALAQSSSGNGELVMCKSGRWTTLGGFTRTTLVQAQGYGQANVQCPSGWKVTGGGYGWGFSGSARGYGIIQSVQSGNGWNAAYDGLYSGALVHVYAVCAQ